MAPLETASPTPWPEFHQFTIQTHITENLDSILSSHPNSGIILTDDFNQFKHQRLCSTFSLKQIVNQATRGNNILDNVFTNISKYHDTPTLLLLSQFNSSESIHVPRELQFNSRSSRLVRDTRPSNRRVVREKLCQVNWSPLYHLQSYDEQFLFFTDTVNEIIEKYLHLK